MDACHARPYSAAPCSMVTRSRVLRATAAGMWSRLTPKYSRACAVRVSSTLSNAAAAALARPMCRFGGNWLNRPKYNNNQVSDDDD
jgi:hypothetical protein